MKAKQVELSSGKRWEAVADGPADPVTGKRKQIRRRGKTKGEAIRRVKAAKKRLEETGIDEKKAKSLTFEVVAKKWIKAYEHTGVKRGSVRIREKEIKILNRFMASIPVDKITPDFYQEFIYKISKEYARTTVQGVNVCAGLIFRFAIKNKWMKDNPKDGVVVPRKKVTVEDLKKDKIEEKYLTSEEVEHFLDMTRKIGLPLDVEWFYLLAFTGMRSGELCALKWEDINFETDEIRIIKTLYNENNNMKEYEITPPKTEGSIRTIEVDENITEMLRRHRKKQMNALKEDDYHDENFVFARPNGYPYIPKNIGDRMRRIMNVANIEKEATPHTFRHTHVSMLTEAGVDIASIMDRVGHDDVQTTMKVYTHVTKKMKKNASAKIKNLYEDALSKLM